MGTQKTLNSEINLKKEKWSWRNQAPWFQTMLWSCSHPNSMVLEQKYKVDQWNWIESPEINLCTYGHPRYEKRGKNIQWSKDFLFNKWCWENETASCPSIKLEHCLTPHIKINSQWTKGVNSRPDTINVLAENIGITLFDIHCDKISFMLYF